VVRRIVATRGAGPDSEGQKPGDASGNRCGGSLRWPSKAHRVESPEQPYIREVTRATNMERPHSRSLYEALYLCDFLPTAHNNPASAMRKSPGQSRGRARCERPDRRASKPSRPSETRKVRGTWLSQEEPKETWWLNVIISGIWTERRLGEPRETRASLGFG
jgi:hypothetical protein